MAKIYGFQKELAYDIAKRIQHYSIVTLALPVGCGKAVVMTEVARLLRQSAKKKKPL